MATDHSAASLKRSMGILDADTTFSAPLWMSASTLGIVESAAIWQRKQTRVIFEYEADWRRAARAGRGVCERGRVGWEAAVGGGKGGPKLSTRLRFARPPLK